MRITITGWTMCVPFYVLALLGIWKAGELAVRYLP